VAYTDDEESSDSNTKKSSYTKESSSSSSSSYDTERDDVYDFNESFRARDSSSSASSSSSSESSYYEHDADLEKGKEFYEKIESLNRREDMLAIRKQRLLRKVYAGSAAICCLLIGLAIIFAVNPRE